MWNLNLLNIYGMIIMDDEIIDVKFMGLFGFFFLKKYEYILI